MLESQNFKSLISNLLGITQLTATTIKSCGRHWGYRETASNRCFGYNADAIVKTADSLFNAVSLKNQNSPHCATTEEHIRTTLLNVQMETLWEDVHALPGILHIHCVKKDLPGKIKISQVKNDECSIIHPLKYFSNENAIPVQQKVVKHFAIAQYVIPKFFLSLTATPSITTNGTKWSKTLEVAKP